MNFEIRKEIQRTKEFGRQKGLCFLLLELTPKKDVFFIIGDLNAKVGSQETSGVTGKFGLGMRNEAEERLIEFCQKNALVIANTLFKQEKTLHMDITRWSTPKSD